MPTQENGIASNVARPAAVNIASSTPATPIAVTTGSNHGLTTGDTVIVLAHLVNPAANGITTVVVTGLTTFTLTGTVGSGPGGGATGTVQSLGFNATFPIPADGVDNDDSATYNAAFQPLADRTAWEASRVGPLYMIQYQHSDHDDDAYSQWSLNTGLSSTWGDIQNTPTLSIWGIKGSDIVEVDFQATGSVTTGTVEIAIGLGGTKVPGTGRRLPVATDNDCSLHGSFGAAIDANKYDVTIMCEDHANAGTHSLQLNGDWSMTVKVWRVT